MRVHRNRLIVTFVCSGYAHGVSGQVRISTPPECASIVDEVAEILGQRAFIARADALDWVVTHDRDGYLGRVWMRRGAGANASATQRELHQQNCADLTHAAAMVIAFAVDPERTQRYLDGQPEVRETQVTPASLEVATPAAAAPIAARGFALAVLGNVGWASAPTLGAQLRVWTAFQRWALGLSIETLPWTNERVGSQAHVDLGIALLGVSLGLDLRPLSNLAFEPWIEVQLGPQWAIASGLDDARTAIGFSAAAQVGMRVRWEFSGAWFVELAPSLRCNFARARFAAEPYGEVFVPSLWQGALTLGLGFSID